MAKQRFVLLPGENRYNSGQTLASVAFMARAAPLRGVAAVGGAIAPRTGAPPAGPPHVLATIETEQGTDGWLVELDDAERLRLRQEYPDLQLVREGTATMALARPELLPMPMPTMAAARRSTATLTVRAVTPEGKALVRAWVQLAFEGSEGYGAQGETDRRGEARLLVPRNAAARYVRVEPMYGHWHAAAKNVRWAGEKTVTVVCPTIDPATPDVRTALGGPGTDTDGQGVTVAVIDGGAGPHRALPSFTGVNLSVPGHETSDITDNGVGHGTHVAGIIAGRRSLGGIQGMAPGVALMVYCVYDKNSTRASSFAVASAVRRAVDEGADVINLSLTLPGADPVLQRQLERARAKGCVVVVAAGNDGGAVGSPAREDVVLAVSAAGCKGTWPRGAAHDLDVLPRPKGQKPAYFMAKFTNHGPEIDLVGPGVGVISLFPRNRLADMCGTSMAAPAMTGCLARALAREAALLSRARDQTRSDAIVKLALQTATSLGFPVAYQGRGLLGTVA